METNQLRKTSKAIRILYPLWMLIGMFGLMYLPSVFLVMDDAAQTAQNIKSNETLFRLGIVSNIITHLFAVFIPILLYWMFKSVSHLQALIMLIVNLLGVPIAMYGEVQSLQLLAYLDQPEVMMSYINTYWDGISIAHVFWGLWLFPLGSLVIKSGYFPKIIGYCLYIAGAGYLLATVFAVLKINEAVLNNAAEILTIGEVLFILWFVIKGPKLPREQLA